MFRNLETDTTYSVADICLGNWRVHASLETTLWLIEMVCWQAEYYVRVLLGSIFSGWLVIGFFFGVLLGKNRSRLVWLINFFNQPQTAVKRLEKCSIEKRQSYQPKPVAVETVILTTCMLKKVWEPKRNFWQNERRVNVWIVCTKFNLILCKF